MKPENVLVDKSSKKLKLVSVLVCACLSCTLL